MTRTVLGETAKAEIRESIKSCRTRNEIAAEAERLSIQFNVGKARIYELTKDVRPKQKTRADKGKRAIDIRTDPNLRLAVGRILEYGVSTADSLIMGEMRNEPVPVSFTTVNRYMHEAGLTKKTRRTPDVPHRRFEAAAPGDMFQFDISGVKERWYDHQTRRIIAVSPLEVSKNHENEKASRTRVWRFALVDDYSRRCFVRYVGVAKPNSSHVVDFLLQAYAELGVPKKLYTDNDKIIKFGRNARATEILNKTVDGGYENIFHMPGNSRATGKVERIHQTIEMCEKFIGQYIAERGFLTLEMLNEKFAIGVQNRINSTIHSETKQTPMERWEAQFSVIRRLDYEELRSAFMCDEHIKKLRGDLTVRINGQSFQLPQSDMYPFANWIGQKLRIVLPDEQNYFTVVGLDGIEYDIPKEISKPDAAGDYRSTRETDAERLRKEVRAIAKADAKQIKVEQTAAPIRYFDEPEAEVAASNVTRFPKPETVAIEPVRLAEIAPGRPVPVHNPAVNFWEAVGRYEPQFGSKSECKQFMDSLFSSRDEECWLLQSEIEEAIERRSVSGTERAQTRILKAV